MPTYEYQCEACSHGFELEQRITEQSLRKCPKCKKLKLRRLIGGGGTFILKGSGWYADLYSSKAPDTPDKSKDAGSDSKGAGGKADAPTDSAKKDSGKSESKGEKKKKTKSKKAG